MKEITYNIKIYCDVLHNGIVRPYGCEVGAKDEDKKILDLSKIPNSDDIQLIWLGKSRQYPNIK